MFHRTVKLRGYHLQAVDGSIGHVDDFLFDERDWTIRYLLIDTSDWVGGKSVLVSTMVVTAVDAGARRIDVSLTREQIKAGPTLDVVDIPLSETLPTVWIM